MTSFRSYIAPLFKRFTRKTDYNIDILPCSHVTKILTSVTSDGKNNKLKANGVELIYKMEEKNKKIINICANGEVIVSAGTIGTPHILLLSGIGPKNELNEKGVECVSDIAGVGKNLQDHMMAGIRLRVPKDVPLLTEKEGKKLKNVFEYFLQGSGWLTTISCDAQLFCKSETGKRMGIKTNDLQLVVAPAGDQNDRRQERYKYHINDNIITFHGGNNMNEEDLHSLIGLVFTLHNSSIGEIKLKNNKPFEYPIIDLEYLSTEYDKQMYIDGILLMKDILNDKIYKDLGCKLIVNDEYKNDEEYWSRNEILKRLQETALTVYHPVGTCKMGNVKNDKMAVCD
eukprot:387265_1